MVENLGEKIIECLLNWGHSILFCVQLGLRNLSILLSSTMSTIQGLLLSIEVNGRTVWTFRIVRNIFSVWC